MSRRGRPPKPTALKLLQGTYRPDRANRDEPMPNVKAPTCSRWLPTEGKREWRRIAPELVRLGLLTNLDRAALAAYCAAWADYAEAHRIVDTEGLTVPARGGGLKKHPAASIMSSAAKDLRAWAGEFGMTPSARSRVHALPETLAKPNPFDSFIE